MLTETIINETSSHLQKVINTSTKSSFSSTSSTHDIQLHNDVTKADADICINKTQTLDNILFNERNKNSETKIEQPFENNNYSVYQSNSNNKMHPFVYFISYEVPPMNSSPPNSLDQYDSTIESKPADIQATLPGISAQPAINSSFLIPYSGYPVNPFINYNFPFVPSANCQFPNHLQPEKCVEEFQNAFFIQSSSSILFRRTNRVFFPLYCGTCKVYGCQCFYPFNNQHEYINQNQNAQYSGYPNLSIPFHHNKESKASMEQTKSKQNLDNQQKEEADKSLENSMEKTVQPRTEPNLNQKATNKCQYYQQRAPAPLHSIIELNADHRNNTKGPSLKNFYPTIEQNKKKNSHSQNDNQNNTNKYSTFNHTNIVKKPKFNRIFDKSSFQEKNDFIPSYYPNKSLKHGNGNMIGHSNAKYSNQNYLRLNESHLKNREFKYFQPSFLEFNKSKQSNDFCQMDTIQSKSTNKNLPLCRLGPNCKFKRQNRCKFDHSKDAEHPDRSEKLVTSKNFNLGTNTSSLTSSAEQPTALKKLTEYYSIDSYLKNPSLIN